MMSLLRIRFTQIILVTSIFASCGKRAVDTSSVDVSDVQHTPAKRQAIGNCWLYATATWAESLHLSSTHEALNISESYWTYWDWYQKIVYGNGGQKIGLGGTWQMASQIIQTYGWMKEGDFLPGEETLEMSNVQMRAQFMIDTEMREGGRLAMQQQRTPQNTMAVLDSIFGVNMAALKPLRHQARDFVIGRDRAGNIVNLDAVINGAMFSWQQYNYPVVNGRGMEPSVQQKNMRKNIIWRVMRALNDHQPVMMSVMVDFNAIKTTPYSTFDLQTLKEKGTGFQGSHLVVLEDYVVENVPGIGSLGEGELSPELKAQALNGDVVYFKAKNSWGTNRPERGLTDGYTAFRIDYLNANLPWSMDPWVTDPEKANWYTALNGFILPAGY